MSETKREFNFPIESTEQLIELVKGLSELEVDIDANSTPSSIKISVYGSEGKVREVSKKIHDLVEESKSP